MKTILTTAFAILLFTITCRAQNTFPSTGNVGIGTTTPAGKLQVQNSNWDLLTATNTLDIGVSGNAGGWARSLRFVNTSGSNGADGGAFGVYGLATTPNYVYMAIPTATTSPIGYNSTNILVLNNSGNVGIGTIAPGLRAHVLGPLGFPAASGSTQTGILRLQGTGSNGVLDFSVNGSSGAALQATAQNDLSIIYSLLLNPNGGNVGIGTLHPDAKLTVNGQVHSTSVVVESTVPADYVFNNDYYLRPLADVKTYVDKNHHLPGVPSAAEFKKDGQDLGEMNMTLLKKVEELTLYMIELNKTVKAQQKEIEQLKKGKH